jgi:hypothetical protein
MFGRFKIYDHIKLNFGIAYQVAVVPDHHITSPLTPFVQSWVGTQRAYDFLGKVNRSLRSSGLLGALRLYQIGANASLFCEPRCFKRRLSFARCRALASSLT